MHVDQFGQVLAIDVFHYQEDRSGRLVRVESGHDVGVVELSGDLDFALKALHRARGTGQRRGQFLERHQPFHAAVTGLEHAAHAPLSDLIQDDVISEDQSGATARVDATCLVFGELPCVYQTARQYLYRVLCFGCLVVALERSDVFRRHEFGINKAFAEFFDRESHVGLRREKSLGENCTT